MNDLQLFIILLLTLLFLCRMWGTEGFEDSGETEEVAEEEVAEEEEEVAKEESDEVLPTPKPEIKKDQFQGWDKRNIFSSPNAPNFGSLLELKEIQHLNNLFSKRNTDSKVPPEPIESQMPSLSEGSTVPNVLDKEEEGAADEPVEVHMVYASWCGHSQTALKKFEGLVENDDVKTSSGKSVKFVLTEESSDGFKDFKGKVKGFPSYMLKDGETLEEIDVGDRSESSVINAAKGL